MEGTVSQPEPELLLRHAKLSSALLQRKKNSCKRELLIAGVLNGGNCLAARARTVAEACKTIFCSAPEKKKNSCKRELLIAGALNGGNLDFCVRPTLPRYIGVKKVKQLHFLDSLLSRESSKCVWLQHVNIGLDYEQSASSNLMCFQGT